MVEQFNFSEALKRLKDGIRVCREGWNGKGMYIFFNPGSRVVVSEGRPLAACFPVGTPIEMSPYIMMKTADNKCVPWLCSQTDLLADDWMNV